MSAPTPAPGDDRPREGYYPDPSIPGYVRYWNGAAWVPGTSRPAPAAGESLAPPPGVRPAPPAVEETGPHFFDEDPEPRPRAAPADAQHGSRPEPASAWGADRARQSGFGGEQDQRVSWGAPQGADPRVAAEAPAPPEGRSARTDGTATIPPAAPDADAGPGAAAPDGTFVFRRPAPRSPGQDAGAGAARGTAEDEGTMTFRALTPRTPQQGGARPGTPGTQEPAASAGAPAGSGGPGFGAGKAAAARAAAAQAAPVAQAAQPGGQAATAAPQSAPAGPVHQPAPQWTAPPGVPQQAPDPAGGTPVTRGPGGGQSSWAQQVHRLAGPDDPPVTPWKPPKDDPFQAAARRQAAARPAALGKRLAARLVDTVVVGAVTALAAVPLGTKALDHVQAKIEEAELSGRTVTVWLLDGTTSVYLGVILAVLLLSGVLYEALPTAKWGRTAGKRLFGLEVRDIEGHEPPSFGAAVRRWLVFSVPGLLCVGVVGVLWCLFDKPWRQCWHDKAAHTFVAG
ncbi:membrane protein [Streptomyces sp. AS58]|uniref:DUF2510 domain-containing protein n=1 Tax=Streptomyces cadmiisoli TaxID=2184053 RepID=A0A2Z4J2P7_9ACTN|nr:MULTISPECIES: RDD family protein [Streptomyces]AWW39349.1 DUF2510 domain-containing protein [Streptomyces cadmiisoli]KOV54314.1 membrane protein [Streptomyces sp. AS58]